MATRQDRRLAKKNLKKLLAVANNSRVVSAVLFTCPHNPDITLMAVEHAIKHFAQGCKPFQRGTSFSDFAANKVEPLSQDWFAGYWEGRSATVKKVEVEIGPSSPGSWSYALRGQRRRAVLIQVPGWPRFFIDDDDGAGWFKVTKGRGASAIPHRTMPVARVLGLPLSPNGK